MVVLKSVVNCTTVCAYYGVICLKHKLQNVISFLDQCYFVMLIVDTEILLDWNWKFSSYFDWLTW